MSYAKKISEAARQAATNTGGTSAKAHSAGSSSTIEGLNNNPEENQSAVVYDVLSEGPIEGLVDGTNSIFLDKTPVTISDVKHQPITVRNANFTASSLTLVDADSNNSFNNLSTDDGLRYVRVEGGKKILTGNGSDAGVSGSEGSTIITASSAFFAKDDINTIDPVASSNAVRDINLPISYIRIAGAGSNTSTELVAPIIRFISTTSIEIGIPLPRAISFKTAKVDKIATISSITNANTVVLANVSVFGTAAVDVSSVEALVTSPEVERENTVYNYQNFQYAFRNGLPDQPYLNGFMGLGSANIIEAPNQAIEQTVNLFASNNNNTIGGWNANKTPDASASPVIINDSAVSNPNDIDKIKLTFKAPMCIAVKPDSGDEKPGTIELLITLGYKKEGDSNFTEKLIFGPTPSELNARPHDKKTRVWEHPHNSGKIRTETKTPFVESFIIDLAPFKPLTDYQIKIERTNPSQGKHGNYEHTTPLTLDTVEHRLVDKLSYPYAAYAAVLFDAESFSKIPARSYDVKGLKVKVPTNYFPKGENGRTSGEYDRNVTTGVDSGSYQKWDGNFRGDSDTFAEGHANYELVWTDNPAWVFYDLVTNKRYGIGKYIDESQIDKYELYKIARYCDELVADGEGGLEPRFTANLYIQETADALKVLKDITQVFRGMLYWLDGEIQFSQNRYQQPVYTFSKGNTIGGFSYTSPRTQFRSNQIRVTWNDPKQMYKQAVEIVEDTNNILETGKIVPKDVVAFGCTSRGQAHRFGKWNLFTEILETEAVGFQTSINAGFLKPGDVILIQDADRDVISNSGRVSNFNPERLLTLDLTAGSGGASTQINGNGDTTGGHPFYTTAQQGANVVFAGEVNLPSSFSQDACMWEHGGTGIGSWLGVRSISGTYNLTLRSGEGDSAVTATSADGIISNIPISDIPEFDDQVHTVCWEFAPDTTPGTHRLWIDGKLYIDAETSSDKLEGGEWSGGNTGGWLEANSTISGNYSANSWPVTTGSSGLRHYFGELVSSTNYGNSTTKVNLDRSVNLSSGNTFKLSVMYPEGGAYLTDITATINNDPDNSSSTATFNRGDLITHAKVDGTVVKITNSSQAQNAVDSSGNKIELVWNPNSRVETQTISTTGSSVSQVTVSSGFTSPPSPDFMWAIREYDADGSLVNGSAQQYVIIDTKEDTVTTHTISAAKYEPSKFDLVDRGYTLDTTADVNKRPSFDEDTPAPSTLNLSLLKSFNTGLNDETNTPGVTNNILINWGTVLNSDGTQYLNLSHFEVKHNIGSLKENKFKRITAPKDETRLKVPFDGAGIYIVQVQAVNINGRKSSVIQRKIEVTPQALVNKGKVITKIPSEGKIDKHIQISGATVSVDSKNYKLENADGQVFTNPSNGNTASFQQSFSGMSSGDEAYLLFDASESATSGDRLKAVKIIDDTTATIPVGSGTITPGFTYLAELGASNNGISTETGTVSGSNGDNIITGSSTSFTTEFSNGDRVIIGAAGTTRFYSTINYIESDTKMQIADALPRAYSGVTVHSLTFKPDNTSDVMLAKVSYDGSTYSIDESYAEGTSSLGYFHHENTSNTNALSVDAFKTEFGRFPQEGDILIVVNTASSPKASKSYKFSNNAFSEIANFMTGDLVVDGTIEGGKIRSDTQIIAGADDSNKQAVLDGTGTGDNALRIYAGSNVANKATAPFRVTQAGALTATSADIKGDLETNNLIVTGNAGIHGQVRATSLTAGTVTIASINQEVWNEIDARTAPTQNGFYDNYDSTSTGTYYNGVATNFELLGPSSNGYQSNGQSISIRTSMVYGYGQQGSQTYTGDALKATFQFQYKALPSGNWTNFGSAYVGVTDVYAIPGGFFYELDADPDASVSLSNGVYYQFRLTVTPTVTNNVWADSDAADIFAIEFAIQQSSTGTGSGTGTVTSVASGDGLSGGPITGSGTLTVDSTVVRTTGAQTIAGNKTFSNNVTVSGNLTVDGTTTTLNTATLDVEDKNITLNYHASNDTSATADGAGITIQDAVNSSTDATMLWDATNDEFDFSHPITSSGITSTGSISAFGTVSGQALSVSSSGIGGLELGGVSGARIDLKKPNSDDYDLRISTEGTGGIIDTASGEVTIKRAGSTKLATTSSGIDVTGNVVTDGIDLEVNTALYTQDATLSYYGSTNAVYLNGAGNDGWLRLNASGPSNDVNAINIFGANVGIGMTFKTNSSERMRITNGGLVGIGTTSPGSLLHVSKTDTTTYNAGDDGAQRANGATILLENNTATVNSFGQIAFDSRNSGQGIARIVFLDRGSATTDIAFVTENSDTKAEKMRITSSGKVGIGTDSPNYLLSLSDSDGADLHFSNSSTLSDGDYLGRIYGTDSSNNFFTGINMFYHDSDDGEIRFRVKTAGTNTDVMTLVDGRVGIGTTSPNNKLTVSGASDGINIIGTSSYLRWNSGDMMIRNEGSYAMGFHTYDGSSAMVERMRITSTGNVGIGETSPGYNLDVNGSIHGTTAYIDSHIYHTGDTDTNIVFSDNTITLNAGAQGTTFAGSGKVTFPGDINLVDAKSVLLGADDDLRIAHSGSIGTVDNYTGDLIIRQQANDKDILIESDNGSGSTATYAMADGSEGSFKLYHYGNKKFETTSTGATITGNLDSSVVGSGDTGIKFDATNDALVPYNLTGDATRSAAIDLGISGTAKFKGLYLSDKVDLNSGSGSNNAIYFFSNTVKNGWIGIPAWGNTGLYIFGPGAASGNTNQIYQLMADGFIRFYTGGTSGATEKMRIKDDGKVGIGTTSPGTTFHVNSGTSDVVAIFESSDTYADIRLKDNDGSSYIRNSQGNLFIEADREDAVASTTIRFNVDNSEQARIDESARLLVGTTSIAPYASTSTTAQGIALRGDFGMLGASRPNNYSLSLNRADSDGDIINLRKNGVTIGGIGANAGVMTLASPNGNKHYVANSALFPSANNILDLGTSSQGYKDLYLSGTANVGGGTLNLGTADSSSGHINAYENMSFNIDVDNDDTNRYFSFHKNGSSASGSELMRITEDGNVGIGTSSPDRLLDIEGSVPAVRLTDTGTSGMYHEILGDGNSLSIEADDGNVGSNSRVQFKVDGSERARINSSGNLLVGGTTTTNSQSWGRQIASINSGTNGAALTLKDSNGEYQLASYSNNFYLSQGANTRFFIDSSGRVGIGTTSPTGSNLHIAEAGDPTILLEDTDSSNQVKIRFKTTTTEWVAGLHGGEDKWKVAKAGGFGTNDYLVINGSGNVGIGATAPSNRLHVASGTVNTAIARFTGANNDRGLVISTAVSGITNDSIINYDAVSTNSVGQHAFKTDGTERVRIDASGNVGIGDATPDAKLTVQGDVLARDEFRGEVINYASNQNAPYLIAGTSGYTGATTNWNTYGFQHRIKTDSSGVPRITIDVSSGEIICFDSSRKVGIGTTAPAALFNVNSSSTIGWSDLANAYILAGTTTNGIGIDSNEIAIKGDHIYFGTLDAKDIVFRTNGVNERMRIMSGGKIGIGTNSPAKTLEVAFNSSDTNVGGNVLSGGGSGNGLLIRNTNTTAGIYANLDFRANNADGRISYKYNSVNDGDFHFITDNNDSIETKMIIKNAGNVGIGTTSPGEKLHVSGTVRASSFKWNVDGSGHNLLGSDAFDGLLLMSRPDELIRIGSGQTSATGKAVQFLSSTTGAGSLGNEIFHITAGGDSTFAGKIYAEDTNSTSSPTFSFTGHTDSGFSVSDYGNGSDQINIIRDGSAMVLVNQAGLHSNANVYSGSTSAFRNYAGTWAGTTGASGNGFYFLNNHGGNTTKAMELTHDGNVTFSGTLQATSFSDGTISGITFVDEDDMASNSATKVPTQQSVKAYVDANAGGVITGVSNMANNRVLTAQGSTTINAEANLTFNDTGDVLTLSTGSSNGANIVIDSTSGTGRPYKLGSSAGGTFYINDNDTNTARLVISSVGNVGVGVSSPSAKFQVEEYGIDTTTFSVTTTQQAVAHSFAATAFRSARYTVQITNTTDSTYQISEILMIHDGTTPSITEYGVIFTGVAAEATFDADINSGNVRLLATPASADNRTFKIVCHSITA